MNRYANPVNILITGASAGIGAALARRYAAPGRRLGLIGRDAARLAHVAEACRDAGAEVRVGLVDVTDAATLADWIERFDDHAPIDLVIANAGVAYTLAEAGGFEAPEAVERQFAVNLHGALNTLHPAVSRMRPRGMGQVALMSSLSGYIGMPISPAYCASKAAIKVYGESLRGVLAGQGIGVSVICPGFVASDMSERFPGPKPFLVSAERAAEIIETRLRHNPARISFPFPLNFVMWWLSTLPPAASLGLQKLFRY